jgi:ABC-2 type transport system permease protein
MQLKISWFNQGIWMQNFRNTGWIGIVHLLALLFALPLQILMAYSNERLEYVNHWNNVFSIASGLQMIIMFTIPVLLAIFSFRYMQVKLSADYIHSLPIRRESLFHQHLIFGFFMLVIPVIISGVSLWLIHGALGLERFFPAAEIGRWIGYTLLIELFVFLAGVFVGMCTGMSILQGALIYIMFLFPAGITILLMINLKFFLFGFAYDYYLDRNIENIIPFIHVANLKTKPFTTVEIVSYLIFSVLFYIIDLRAYQMRNIEAATQAVAFKALRPIFKYGVTFCFMLVGGLHFGETQNNFAWIVFGYVTASALGYFVAEMILEKTWRVFHKWKGYAAFIAIMIVVGTLLQLDVTGYENRQPRLADIKQVYFDNSILYLEEEREEVSPDDKHYEKERMKRFYEEKSNINNIYLFHQQIIKDQAQLKHTSYDMQSVVFGYELKNGKTIVRQYRIPVEKYKAFYKTIVESKEYKQMHYPFLQKDDLSGLEKVRIETYQMLHRNTYITDPKQIEAFVSILKTELEKETAEQVLDQHEPWGTISLYWDNNEKMTVDWKKSYARLDEWLKQNGFEKARITADDIDYAIVIPNKEGKPFHEYIDEELKNHKDAMKITDKQLLEECLAQSGTFHGEYTRYIIAYYLKDNDFPNIEAFYGKYVPDFIKKQLDN